MIVEFLKKGDVLVWNPRQEPPEDFLKKYGPGPFEVEEVRDTDITQCAYCPLKKTDPYWEVLLCLNSPTGLHRTQREALNCVQLVKLKGHDELLNPTYFISAP